ncbi:PspC domain-containing protein [Nocardia callitridis]
MTKTSFGDQLQQLWRTRPVRLPKQGPVAGVAAGFARRYGVDPVLVRIAFVVSTIFGGIGIVLYLVAWLSWSAAGESVSAAQSLVGRGHSSQSPTKTIVLIVALAIAVTTTGPAWIGLGGSGVISLGLMLAGWWMLFLRTPEPPQGTSQLDAFAPDEPLAGTGYPGTVFPQGAPAPGYGQPVYSPYTKLPDAYVPQSPEAPSTDDTVVLTKDPTQTVDSTATADPGPVSLGKTTSAPGTEHRESPTQTATSPSTGTRTTPPAWDPLGVAPLAWDLPEPPQTRTPVAPPPPKRPRSRLTPVVIGLAILAAAGAGALASAGVEWMTPGRIAATALVVIGFGLVLGAFLRRGYGLLVLTAPLAGFVLLASAIGPVEFDRTAMGEHTWAPTSATELQPEYRVMMGTGHLDLRGLHLTENKSVDVTVQMGDVDILLPENMTVRTACTTSMSEATTCVDGLSGPQTPGAPVLDLNIESRAANVEVNRG